MLRIVIAVCVLVCVTGCGSEPRDRTQDPAGDVGRASQAVGSPWDGSASTRSPVSDNTVVSTTSTIGKRGVVNDADAGFCWITSISGSFRGTGEYAKILTNGSGYYQAVVRSATTYDGVTGVGPAMSMRCRPLTDFIALASVGDFTTTGFSVSGSPPAGNTNYGQTSSSATSGAMFPWAGVEGRLGSAGSATWMISAVDHGTDSVFARWAQSCPLTFQSDCEMYAQTWETSANTHLWTYSVTGSSASNTADVQLIAASGQECFIDGLWGYWTSTSSATVQVEGDGYWHLVTQKGSASLGIGAYASCFPLDQGF